MEQIKNIMFICTGNTCRSAMAEGLMKKMLEDKGITNIKDMDLILCATHAHLTTLEYMYPELAHRIFTIKEYAYGPDAQDKDIDDPWGYPAEVYRKCAKEIYDALKLIVDKITNA